MGGGLYAQALDDWEKAMKCSPNPALYPRMYVAACNARNSSKIAKYYSKLGVSQQNSLSQVCIKNGLDPQTGK
jgi:hypothetical protein